MRVASFIHPSRNSADVAELPADVRAQMTFVPATTLDDVLKVALTKEKPKYPLDLTIPDLKREVVHA
mgnify:CR=1 FL=1